MLRVAKRSGGWRRSLINLCIVLLLVLYPLAIDGNSPSNQGNGGNPTPPPPPPPQISSRSPTSTDNQDVFQVVETEIWDGQNWIGQQPTRWTTIDGYACVSPLEIEAPHNTKFEGDWKIVLGEERDDYGWSYVYYYMSSERPRRQRIWLRTVVYQRPSPQAKIKPLKPTTIRNLQRKSAELARMPSLATLANSSAAKMLKTIPAKTQRLPTIFQTALQLMKDDWNFKGFGFSFYKSFLFKRSFGMAFRIPLTTNFDLWDRHPELPRLTMSVSFFYPFTAVITVGGSVDVEYVKWLTIHSAIILRHTIAVVLLSLARGLVLAGSSLAFPFTRQLYQLPDSKTLLPPLDSSYRQRPAFRTTLQERMGMSYSWRLSAKRGYETRRTVWHLYLPTLLSLLEHADQIQQTCQRYLKKSLITRNTLSTTRYLAAFVPKSVVRRSRKVKRSRSDSSEQSASASSKVSTVSWMDYSKSHKWAEWWLRRKTGSLGVSTGYPIPDKPHFSCSAVMSLSGFYFRPDIIGNKVGSTIVASSDVMAEENNSREDPEAGLVAASGGSTSDSDSEELGETKMSTAKASVVSTKTASA